MGIVLRTNESRFKPFYCLLWVVSRFAILKAIEGLYLFLKEEW